MRSFSARGMSLVDVVVGSALVLIIFVGLFGLIRVSVQITGLSKLKAAATAVASSHMEYIRSLEYDAVGTVGGIIQGPIPQNATTTVNGVDFGVRTFITYVDDPADGEGEADANEISTDYKQIKIVVTYASQTGPHEVSLVSNQAPPGVESEVPGGVLRLETVDAGGLPIAGASVHIENDALSPAVDTIVFSGLTGTVLLSGVATSTEYKITTTKSGYSTAGTYERTGTNVNPTPGFLTVADNQTTTATFAIDVLASFTLRTFSPPSSESLFDTFTDTSQLSALTNTQVSGGDVILAGTPGTYAGSGTAVSATTTATVFQWTSVEATLFQPTNTTVAVHVVDGDGDLVSDANLPGNAAGFSAFPVSISALSTTTYPVLGLMATLTTADPTATPNVSEWRLSYERARAPLPDVPFSLTGAKTIGSDAGGFPIYKTVVATTTDATGVRTLPLEWDLYSIALSGHTIVASSTPSPYELLPNAALTVELDLTP